MPESSYSPEELEKVKLALRARMTVHAFHHLTHIHARAGAVLAPSGLLDEAPDAQSIPDELLALMTDRSHASRVAAPDGPLLFYLEGDPPRRLAIPMEVFLLNATTAARRAAVAHFTAIRDVAIGTMTAATQCVLERESDALTSSDPVVWRPAAVRVYDAIEQDFLLSLAGFRQSRRLAYQEGANSYARNLLWPSIDSLQGIQIDVETPSTQLEALEAVLDRCIQGADTLEDALNAWFESLGHLPIASERGLGKLAEHFRAPLGIEELSSRLCRWAGEHVSPLATVHVCVALLVNPATLPTSAQDWLWAAVTSIALNGSADEDGVSASWKVRRDLALHYQYLLECLTPGFDSERIANLAMWLSERVARAFGSQDGHLDVILRRVVSPALDRSRQAWLLTRPAVTPSALWYAILHLRSGWARSLLSNAASLSTWAREHGEAPANAEAMGTAVLAATLEPFPLPTIDVASPRAFAFEGPLLDAAAAWAAPLEGAAEIGDGSDKILSLYRSARDVEPLREKLIALPNSSPADQIYISGLVRVLAYSAALPEDLMWEFASDRKWFKGAVNHLEDYAIESLVQALIELQNQVGGRWTAGLPHFLAAVIADITEDERRRIVFALTMAASIAAGVTTPIIRLMRSTCGPALRSEAADWRPVLRNVQQLGLPYPHARMRPVLAALGRWLGDDEEVADSSVTPLEDGGGNDPGPQNQSETRGAERSPELDHKEAEATDASSECAGSGDESAEV